MAKWLYEVMGQEVDDAEIRFSELREQANPETATWALRYWEQRYGIEVDESRSLAASRADIIARGARAADETRNVSKGFLKQQRNATWKLESISHRILLAFI